MKRLMTVLLALICLAAFPLTGLAAESLRTTVTAPYFQVWKTDVPDADDRFTYRWTAEEEAPVPEGITTSYWDWDLAGNTEGKLPMVFQFDEPGTYQYRLAAFVPNKKPGYVYETRTYLLVILVQNAPGGGLQADWYILNEDSGEKVDLVELDPSYTAGKGDDESESSPGEPTDDSNGTGKVDGEDKGSGKDGSSDGGSDGGQGGSSGNGSTGSVGGGAGSGQGSSAGGSSVSGKSDESGTGIGIGMVRTGDDNVIRSWAAILSVSGLMILYLICREVGERREKKKGER